MVSITKTNYITTDKSGKYFIGELAGLSTDEKPTEIKDMKIGNGSVFVEINTAKIFFYDLDNQEWKEA